MLCLRTTGLLFLATLLFCGSVNGQITMKSSTGFLIEIEHQLDVDAKTAYSKLIDDFSKWYDASHSYSGKAENLSLDLKRHCMYEQLEKGGYVRHMEIVFHQPGKQLRMTGGLGPLQGMGVSGAMTWQFSESDGKAKVKMSYAVSGADYLQLDKIAIPVERVLSDQVTRFKNWCIAGSPDGKAKEN